MCIVLNGCACVRAQKAQEHFVDAELTSMLRSDGSSDSESDAEQNLVQVTQDKSGCGESLPIKPLETVEAEIV